MAWKLDDIDFADYGVHVRNCSGVFDIPAIVDNSTNWLDENGRDYWQTVEDVKYEDKEVVLACWILAGDYADFKAKAQAFYDALTGVDKRNLSTPYGTEIECYLKDEIRMVRHSSYVKNIQLGFFNLRLTVAGDLDFYTLQIKRTFTTNVIATVFTRDLKVQKTLQGDFYATFSFESNSKLDIRYFDEINISSNGLSPDRFYFESEPKPKQLATNKFVYNIRANHMGNWLSHSEFLSDVGESDFAYFANFDEIVTLLCNNHGRDYFARKFFKGTIGATERRLHKFSGENCLAVLRRLCSEYKLEYEFESLHDTQYEFNINVKTQIANDKTVVLEYGKGKGLYEIVPGEMLADEFYTCLFAFGSTKNLKPGYRDGLRRLSFDGNPLKQNYGLDFPAGDLGVKSKTIFYDEIFPRYTGAVTGYVQKLQADLTDAEKYVHPEGIFKLTDSLLSFNINDYLLGGPFAKVVMKTGDLAGFQFEIKLFENDTKEMYIIPFKDERGEPWPNENFMIQVGDEYTLIDIDQPVTYVAVAEVELEAAAQADLDAHCIPKYPYNVTVHPAFVKAQTQPFGFEAGDRVPFIFPEHGVNGLLRISSLVYDVYKGTYELTLSEVVKVPKLKKTDMRLEAIERALGDAKKDTTEATRKDQETTNELRNRLLDPTDDKLNERNFRIGSIDPGMLAPGSGVPQFMLYGALIECNIDGNEDIIQFSSGAIVVTNFYTLDRYSIQKLKDSSLPYDPTRKWTIAAETITLPTKDEYFIYLKLGTDELITEAEIVYTTEIRSMIYEDGYLLYPIGSISAGEEESV